jgi:hypothetical protein
MNDYLLNDPSKFRYLVLFYTTATQPCQYLSKPKAYQKIMHDLFELVYKNL